MVIGLLCSEGKSLYQDMYVCERKTLSLQHTENGYACCFFILIKD